MSSEEIEKQIAALTAAMRGANVSVRSALQAQIAALRAKRDAPDRDPAPGHTLAVDQSLGAAIDMASLSEQAIALYRQLADAETGFALDALRDLAQQLKIDWDGLPGADAPGKARALVRACQNAALLDALQALMLQARR